MSIDLVFENATSINIDISATLTAIGKVQADITDIIFIVKISAKDADIDAKITKTLGSGIVDNATYYTVEILPADFADIIVGKKYIVGVGIKYLGLTNYLELEIGGASTLVASADIIRG